MIAWSGMTLKLLHDWQRDMLAMRWLDIEAYKVEALSIQHLAPNLLRRNSIVTRKAAVIFYGENTFFFAGPYTWNTVAQWLQAIGPQNRSYPTHLDMLTIQPPHVWRHPDGTRTEVEYDHERLRDKLFQRSPYLYRSPDETSEGIVENINPAVDTAFELLGAATDGPNLEIRILLPSGTSPGVQLAQDTQHPYAGWLSMNLPNMLEKVRALHTFGIGKRSVEVLWKGMDSSISAFDREKGNIEDRGWEIVEAVEKEYPSVYSATCYRSNMHFTLKRKELMGRVIADEPSSHSWLGY